MKLNQTLYLIRGVPGSGKSTFAQTLLEEGVVQKHYEADMYFIDEETGEYNFNAKYLQWAHNWCQSHAESALYAGLDVVVSNTSTTEKEVQVYKEIAEKTASKFVCIAVESRHTGTNLHGVPSEKIEQMKQKLKSSFKP